MKNDNSNWGRWVIAGTVLALFLAFTTDQILNNVYDSSNTALRTKLVSGGGTPVAVGTATPLNFGTPGVLAAFAATELGAYPGSACTPPALALSTSAAGVWTCATPVPSGGAGASPVTITLANASSTGTTTNKLAKVNTDGTAVIVATTDTTGAIGPVVSGAGTTGSAVIQVIGSASCVFDGATTAGDYVGISSGTAGDCTDVGSTFPSLVSVLGVVTSTNGGAGTYTVIFDTPDIMNATNIKGGNPGKGNTVDFTYSGKLNVAGINAISASATPAAHDRQINCTSGSSSDQTYTLPASTGGGRVISVTKVDAGTKACIVGRAGGDTLNGATTKTLSFQWQTETCSDFVSGTWVCQGDGI